MVVVLKVVTTDLVEVVMAILKEVTTGLVEVMMTIIPGASRRYSRPQAYTYGSRAESRVRPHACLGMRSESKGTQPWHESHRWQFDE